MKSKDNGSYEIDALRERLKELNCLYNLTNIVKNTSISFEDSIQKIVELIPPAWQYPEITCARIVIEGKEYKTKNKNYTQLLKENEQFFSKIEALVGSKNTND